MQRFMENIAGVIFGLVLIVGAILEPNFVGRFVLGSAGIGMIVFMYGIW